MQFNAAVRYGAFREREDSRDFKEDNRKSIRDCGVLPCIVASDKIYEIEKILSPRTRGERPVDTRSVEMGLILARSISKIKNYWKPSG